MESAYKQSLMEAAILREWTSFNGKVCSFTTIDHQHLSNCFYYWKYAIKGFFNYHDSYGHTYGVAIKNNLDVICYALRKRFDGNIMPYRPNINFPEELEALKKAGYLQDNGKIIADGKEIGEVIKYIELDGKNIPFEDILNPTIA